MGGASGYPPLLEEFAKNWCAAVEFPSRRISSGLMSLEEIKVIDQKGGMPHPFWRAVR
jgi:hypothetical protein